MRLQYGSYTHALGSPSVAISRTTLFNDAQVGIGWVERWDITGMLLGSTQAAINAAILALENAYSFNNRNARLLLSNGAPSAHGMLTVNALGGVRVVAPPSYPDGGGGEFATKRTFTVSLEAEFPYVAASKWLLSFEETLAFDGDGGPLYGFLYPLQDKPIKQKLRAYTSVKVTQSGRAVGYGEYPDADIIAPPFWPQHIMRRTITPGSPKRIGPAAAAYYKEWPVAWQYEFESASPLRNNGPHKWKG